MPSTQSRTYEFDVAFSYASRDREYVDRVARFLQLNAVQVYYDVFDRNRALGEELYDYLFEIYYNKARFCVMFISGHYADSVWASHERQVALTRQYVEGNSSYLVLGRFDATVIPGVRPTIVYIDLKSHTPEQFGREILRKMGRLDPADGTRDSWESYGWLFNVDGYRVPYVPLLNDFGTEYTELTLKDLDIIVDDTAYSLPSAFQGTAIRTEKFNKPSCRLDSYSVSESSRLTVRFQETSYRDYLRSGELLDGPLPDDSERTYRHAFGAISRKRSGDLSPFPLTNICGVGIFILTSDRYIVASTHSQDSHVYPGRMTFASSGTMAWGAFPDPFTEIARKAAIEVNHLIDIRKLHLVAFGADARKLYFQFSFLEHTQASLKDVTERCGNRQVLFPIRFALEHVRNALLEHCWEPAAEATLLNLCAHPSGRVPRDAAAAFTPNAVARELNGFRHLWGAREMRDEWDYRAARPGLLPDMSVRYPIHELQSASEQYIDHACTFLGSVAGKKILEIGSGTGRFTQRLLAAARNLTCIELSTRMIELMKARLKTATVDESGFEIKNGMAQDILPLHGYDLVVCSLVLIHNVRDSDFNSLVSGMCGSADTLFVFEDVTKERKTSPHTKLRDETALLEAFEKYGFFAARKEYHALVTDTIVMIEFKR